MATEVARNVWGAIVHHANERILELRWLPSTMTDNAFKATLALFASEAEKLRPSFLLIDATDFRHSFANGVMEWRNDTIIPRYGAAGVKAFAFCMPAGFSDDGKEGVEGPAVFPTKWFTDRDTAIGWLEAKG